MLRKAVFAGSFYDASPDNLKRDFEKWFKVADLPELTGRIVGVICPHAGFIYSGQCAAHSYKFLSLTEIDRAVIIHPSHRGSHFGYSISPYTEYETPLGNLKRNEELAEKLSAESEETDIRYHQNEHSMEVQLPFLKYVKPDIEILPVMLGSQNRQVSERLADVLKEILVSNPSTAIVISSDLSHYHSSARAETMDGKLIDYILKNNANDFYESVMIRNIEACGFGGIMTLLKLGKAMHHACFTKLHYTHSGYTSCDFGQVVGYLSAALIQKEN